MTQPAEESTVDGSHSTNGAHSAGSIASETPCGCGTESNAVNSTNNSDSSCQTSASNKKTYNQLKKKNSKKTRGKGKAKDDMEPVEVLSIESSPTLPTPKSSWLLRLFESKLCDMAIAIAYMFKSKESGVLAYLGNKLFVSHLLSCAVNYSCQLL